MVAFFGGEKYTCETDDVFFSEGCLRVEIPCFYRSYNASIDLSDQLCCLMYPLCSLASFLLTA